MLPQRPRKHHQLGHYDPVITLYKIILDDPTNSTEHHSKPLISEHYVIISSQTNKICINYEEAHI